MTEDTNDKPVNKSTQNPPEDIAATSPVRQTTIMDTHAEELHKAPGHGIRHYLFEFLMLFLAVFCGFLADNYRESLVNKEKERHYLQNMIVDLKADTADLNFDIYYQQLWYNHLDTALKIPPEQLKDINKQDTFFYHFLPYYKWMQPFLQNDNTITQLRSGGFNLIKDEHVIDSINMVYNFYKNVKFGNDFSIICYWDVVHKAQQLINLPAPGVTIEEDIPKQVLHNREVFIQYDLSSTKQLYSMITNAQGTSLSSIETEKQYRAKAERLLTYLENIYSGKE